MFLSNFLIALREGVEAALVVGILIAYLVKTGHRDVLPTVWTAITLAAIVPLAAGAYMTWGPYTLSFAAQEALGGGLSLLAVGFVTWMIWWMGTHSRSLAAGLTAEVEDCLKRGSHLTLAWVAALTVGREGVETAVFVWATVKSAATTQVLQPALGVLAGLVAAIIIGALIYRGSMRLNLRKFFLITGVWLLFIAAGIAAYGIGDLQEASLLPGWGHTLWDLNTPLGDHVASWWYVLLNATFNIEALFSPTLLQLLAWLGYAIIASSAFIWQTLKPRPAPASTATRVIPAENEDAPAVLG